MLETPTHRSWIRHLDTATGALPGPTTLTGVYRALALAWQASGAVAHPASVTTELGWMRLAEALNAAWTELATVVDPPTAAPFEAGIPDVTGQLDDTVHLRASLIGLMHATAAALRTHAATNQPTVDAALTMTDIAAELDACLEGWP
jgi:hypothetical protein